LRAARKQENLRRRLVDDDGHALQISISMDLMPLPV
jgi:hypothetical protein